MSNPSLHELQTWMKQAITDPRGVQSALPVIEDPSDRSTIQRLNIYAEAYFSRLHDVIAADFPRCRRIVGDSLFQKLIANYLVEFPSRTTNISEVAKSLPKFLEELTLSDEFPFLPCLADLEWQATLQIWRPSPPEQSQFSIQMFAESDPDTLELILNPTLQFLRSKWEMDRMWSDSEAASFQEISSEQNFLMFRNRQGLNVQSLTGPQFQLLKWLEEEKTLSEIFELFQETFPQEDLQLLPAWLQAWTAEQIICDFRIQPSH